MPPVHHSAQLPSALSAAYSPEAAAGAGCCQGTFWSLGDIYKSFATSFSQPVLTLRQAWFPSVGLTEKPTQSPFPHAAPPESRSELPHQLVPKSGGRRFRVRQERIKGARNNVIVWKAGGTTKSREDITQDRESFKADGLTNEAWDASGVGTHSLGHVFAGCPGI